MAKCHRPLGEVEQVYLCEQIRGLALLARDPNNPWRHVERRRISAILWQWTADAVNTSTGAVDPGVYKYNCRVHIATRQGIALAKIGSVGLRHEHAVPRMFITDRIIKRDLSAGDIFHLLRRLCVAVIVTKEEDRKLRPKNKMPLGWSWDDGDPYARYVHSELDGALVRPR
jgi:hypothetical protein